MEKREIRARVNDPLVQKLQNLGYANHRSLTYMIEAAIEEYVRRRDENGILLLREQFGKHPL